MKRKGIFVLLFLLLLVPVQAVAKNHVTEIDIDVVIREDGSAYITQVWNGTFSEGTENYIPIRTDGIEISDFRVSDENGEYRLMPKWDIDATFEEKSRKCGINETKDGVELCFGISKYDTNRYAIEYVVHGFIKSYSDYDGTNFMFINPDMNTFPTDGKVSILLQSGEALDKSNARIWGFGYKGQIEFQNGKVVAYTETPLDGSRSMIVMLQLNKGLVHPRKSDSRSFDEIKERAMKGSDYDTDEIPDWLARLIGVGFILAIFAAIVLALVLLINKIINMVKLGKFYNEAEYFRGIPNNGDMAVTYFLSKRFHVASDESLIIGATLLSMMNRREIEPVSEERVGFFGKVKTEVSLVLRKEPDIEPDRQLYHILIGAAREDGILQEKELAAYAEDNPKLLRQFIAAAQLKGASTFGASGGFVKSGGKRLKDLSDAGKAQLAEAIGLKKYLLDFSLIAERTINEIDIWQDYMVYAALFGIADKVLAQFKKVYPERITEFESYNRNVLISYSYYRTMLRSTEKAEQAARASGFGGASSIGGGGGFSGGGAGGGSR